MNNRLSSPVCCYVNKMNLIAWARTMRHLYHHHHHRSSQFITLSVRLSAGFTSDAPIGALVFSMTTVLIKHYAILNIASSSTGCSSNIVFFPKILEYSGLWSFSVFPRCKCVYTHQAGRTPALQQN